MYTRWVFLGLLWLWAGCSSSSQPLPEATREGRPDQESWDVTITLSEGGRERAVIRAGHLTKFNERYYTNLEDDVIVDMFNADRQHTFRLYADRAEVDERAQFMRAISHVVVLSDSGVDLATDTLSWDQDESLVYTDDSVRVTTEAGDTLYGVGFESDARLENWTIEHPTGSTGRRYDH
ncbi:MAG: LPS export ABC transporter periplasmic protein LptC [Candidatus Neomarinimicrobiota bacterium]|nr:MAG: LPS export ABC transporter periplasmic protein LptC [Candidatus Neomarinimicrobiota bacterium]